jgi:exodeoxyribonuclease VII small subunit
MAKAKDQPESFEKLFAELEETIAKLEAGDLSLDESLALYQRGMELAKQCGDLLDQAELRIKVLAPQGNELIEADLEESEGA